MTSDLQVVSWNMKEIFEGSKFRRNDHSHCQDMVSVINSSVQETRFQLLQMVFKKASNIST